MCECSRCGKPIHHNYFPKAVMKCSAAILFSHNVYNYLNSEYVLCTKCKNAFNRFMKCENDTKCTDFEVRRAENGR